MIGRMRMRALLAVPVLLLAVGGGAAQPRQDECLARLPTDLVTVSLRDTDIAITLRLMAQQYRVNLVVTDDVKGTVTLDFFKVPAREVMQAIIAAGALRCIVAGDVLRVSTIARLQAEDTRRRVEEGVLSKARGEQARLDAEARMKEIESRRAEREAAEEAARGPVQEEMIPLHYADAEQVARTIAGILGVGGLQVQGQQGFSVPTLPQLSQLYVPSPPVVIPSTPAEPLTAPAPSQPPSPEAVAKGLTVGFYKKTNSVFIRYYARDLARIKKMIREDLDVPLAQIQIRAQMVITTLSALEQIGVQWGAAGAGNVNGTKVIVGQGFAAPNTGGAAISPATPTQPLPPPVPPPTVGNLVNLPTAFLPTLLGATPAGGLLLGLIGSNFNVNLAVQALEINGKARTLAEPKIVTEENTKAVISRGFEVPFTSTPTTGVSQVQFKEALLRLEVTPRLIREPGVTKIRMKVVFDNDFPDFTNRVSVAGNPSIFKRHQETEVVIREGQRLVVGGVMNDDRNTFVREVPVFGRIPVIGWLFKSREVSSSGEELIVILTPTVVTAPGQPLPR